MAAAMAICLAISANFAGALAQDAELAALNAKASGLDAEDYRRRFPDGRIGSDPSQASIAAGEKIVALSVRGLIGEFRNFAAS